MTTQHEARRTSGNRGRVFGSAGLGSFSPPSTEGSTMNCKQCMFGTLTWRPGARIWQCDSCRHVLHSRDELASIAGPPRVSRPTDPDTSHRAEVSINTSGRRLSIMRRVLRALKTSPDGMTSGEIADATELGYYQVERRISDLKNLGRIRNSGEVRQWKGSGHAQSVWVAVVGEGR